MWGPDILVAPVYEKGARLRDVYLPAGSWVHYWTGAVHVGAATIAVDAPLGKDPLFVRAGSIIPERRHSDTIPSQSDESLILLAFPGDRDGAFDLYDDDRETYRYEQGEHSSQSFAISRMDSSGSFTIRIGAVVGDHKGVQRTRNYRIEVPTTLAAPRRATLDGREVAFVDKEDGERPSRISLDDRTVFVFGPLDGPAEIAFHA
jgi:alpha-D-xyloside xylohydrolase